jgi:hypothetical protein
VNILESVWSPETNVFVLVLSVFTATWFQITAYLETQEQDTSTVLYK